MTAKKKKIVLVGAVSSSASAGAEFDHACAEAMKALRDLGFDVALISANPTAVSTDNDAPGPVYFEAVSPENLAAALEREKATALLPVFGGGAAVNAATAPATLKAMKKLGVSLMGVSETSRAASADRRRFLKLMKTAGVEVPPGAVVSSVEEAEAAALEIGFPAALRPLMSEGGAGNSTAYNMEDLEGQAASALKSSAAATILVEKLLRGWKEIEMVLLRDAKGNAATVAMIENIDPAGIHSGDSAAVIPAQTLTLSATRRLKKSAVAVARALDAVGVVNVRFALEPASGDIKLIYAVPRYTRSSAFAARATGYPVARVAAKLVCGLTLDGITEPEFGGGSAFREPEPDYCATRLPRFDFEKFPGADDTLDTAMKSTGGAMGAGRTFKESLLKAMRALETSRPKPPNASTEAGMETLRGLLSRPNPARLFHIFDALAAGMRVEEIRSLTLIDGWFVSQFAEIAEISARAGKYRIETAPASLLKQAKLAGLGDEDIARLLETEETELRRLRKKQGTTAGAGAMDASGAARARYAAFESTDAAPKGDRGKKIIILGGGPNRIGQGIEFDYCCVHAAYAIKEAGYTAILINSNPETVSTDFDTSDRLYFEPLTFEDVMNIIDREKPHGVIVQLGGQTPLNLATKLLRAGAPILGTSPDNIDRAEDRKRFKETLDKLNLTQPDNDTAGTVEEAVRKARQIGYPLLVRPSYVLGGRAMRVVYEEADLREYMAKAVSASPDKPVLLDRFLDDAIEVDVDAVADGERCLVCGVMEHIEQAGVHSGDSACCLPPYTLNEAIVEEIKGATRAMARELGVVGLMNVQFAVKNDVIYVLEVNPRASRTVPFVSKATGTPWAKVAARVMLGESLEKQGVTEESAPEHMSVKEAVFPFSRFPGVDATLGPEMLSTGEVMGIDRDFGMAFLKSQIAAGQKLPDKGAVFVSVKNSDKRAIVPIARKLIDMGFEIVATEGTASTLRRNGIEARSVHKLDQGRPNILDVVKNKEVVMLINTPAGKDTKVDEAKIRSAAIARDIPLVTTISGAQATVQGMEAFRERGFTVAPLQEYHKKILAASKARKAIAQKAPVKKIAAKKTAAKKSK